VPIDEPAENPLRQPAATNSARQFCAPTGWDAAVGHDSWRGPIRLAFGVNDLGSRVDLNLIQSLFEFMQLKSHR